MGASLLDLFNEVSDCMSKRWVLDHFDYPHSDYCLIWPFGRKGGGYADFSGKNILVHRLMCEYRNGPAPSSEHQAAHSCERGHDGCVNQHHLSWKTPSGNQLDRFRDGALKPSQKLTPEQALMIRNLKGLEPAEVTAARFQVHESNVRLIQAGKTWRKLPRATLTREQVDQIRTKPYTKTAKQWAEELGVSAKVITRARQFETYKYYEAPTADRGEA